MHKNLKLFLTFLKIGTFTFGGGYAMISLIENEIVSKNKWISEQDMVDMIAIAESTPGVIAVNSATYVGYKVGKLPGAILATLGVVLPSLFIIFIISFFLTQFQQIEWIRYLLMGIQAAVILLILNAFLKISKKCAKNILFYIIFAITFILSLFFKGLSIYLILGGIITGIITEIITKKNKEGHKDDLS